MSHDSDQHDSRPVCKQTKLARPKSSRYRHCAGLDFAYANELVGRSAQPLASDDKSPLARAIRSRWPDADPHYWRMIYRRFTELYSDLPLEDAIKAIRAGLSSPSAAFRARLIRKRNYIGFKTGA